MPRPRRAGEPSALVRILDAEGLRRVELAAAAGVTLRVVDRVARGEIDGMKIATLCRVAWALGLAPAELVPGLAVPPRKRGGVDVRYPRRSAPST